MAAPVTVTLHTRDDYRPFEVRAILQDGIIRHTEYSIDLAGLLHSRARVQEGRTVGDESMIDDPAMYLLPLARCTTDDGWLWCASAEIVADAAPMDSRTFRRADDVRWSMVHSNRPIPEAVHPLAGPFRDVMMPASAAVVHEARWRGLGDPDAVRRLLSTVFNVGKRRNSGEGKVLAWEVREPPGIVDELRWPFIDGNRIIRPCPPEMAADIDHTLAWHSSHPPSWNPETMMHLAVNRVDNTQSA